MAHIAFLLKKTYDRMQEFNISLHGAAIAFYAIFSTAPLIIILIWLVSHLLGPQVGHAEFQATLQTIVGPEISTDITEIVESTSQSTSGFWSSILAIFALLFGATTLLTQVKHTLNMIWGVEDQQIGTVWHFLWSRMRSLIFIGALCMMVVLGMVTETFFYVMENLITPFFGTQNVFLLQSGSRITNILLTFCFFAAMFKILPDIKVRWRDISVGAIVTTLLVIAGKALVDWYLGWAALNPAYKAAGSFVIFLIWIYYNVQVVLAGAIFTQVFTSKYGGEVKPFFNGNLRDELYSSD